MSSCNNNGNNRPQFPDFSQLFNNINFEQLEAQMAPIAVAFSEAIQGVAAQAHTQTRENTVPPGTNSSQTNANQTEANPIDQFVKSFSENMENVQAQFAPVAVAISEAVQNIAAQTRANAEAQSQPQQEQQKQESPKTESPAQEKAKEEPKAPNSFESFMANIDTEQIEAQLAPIAVAISESVQNIASQLREGVQVAQERAQRVAEAASQPSREVKVVNDEEKFSATINVSEYRPEQLNVYVNDRTLVIEGHQECTDSYGGSHIQNFGRSWPLPESADADNVSSHLTEDGLLTVTAPKAGAKSSAKTIPITVVKK